MLSSCTAWLWHCWRNSQTWQWSFRTSLGSDSAPTISFTPRRRRSVCRNSPCRRTFVVLHSLRCQMIPLEGICPCSRDRSRMIPIRKSAPVLSRTRAPLRWDSRHPKGRRIQLHSSARGSLRGVTSDSSYGVAEHGADGPARRSSSVGRTWWTGPPPSSFAAGCRGPRQDGQAAKTKLLPRSCLRFWTRAWGQRELADERTGRLKKPRSIAGFVQGWAGHPSHPRPIQLTSQGTPDLDV